jgi:cell division protein FtsX
MSGGGRARILAALALGVAVAALLATVLVVVVNRDELVALLPVPEPPAPEATVLGYWGGKIDASVFLLADVDAGQRAAAERRVRAAPAVNEVFYKSKAEALTRFRTMFRDNPELTGNVTEDQLPESYRVRLDSASSFAAFHDALCKGPARQDGGEDCGQGIDVVLDMHKVLAKPLAGSSWNGRADAAVVLAPGVTRRQRAAVRDRLEAIDGVERIEYESREQAWERLKGEYSPEELELAVPARGMLDSFRVKLSAPGAFESFKGGFCASPRTGDCAPGVAVVIDQRLLSSPD